MKVTRIYYNDDDILVTGHLIERIFRRPVFYPFDGKYGFSYQYVTRKDCLVEFTGRAYREFYKKTYPAGTKIKMIAMRNEPRPVPNDVKGIVKLVDDQATIHCVFEDGRRIGVIPGLDAFIKIKDETI